jgi:23S rRNA pseudouridine1911/1915/1917 synthase
MEIKILYEDENILALDKPSGLMVHSDGRSKEYTVTDWLIENYPSLKGVGEPVTYNDEEIDRPGIVHRLDKDTSGVLLVMKTREAFSHFKKQFMDRKIHKEYHAVVSGWLKNDSGLVNAPIGRSPADFRRRLSGRGARGEMREALTHYKVLKRYKDEDGNKFSYLEISPKTGRTHQIRVHMKFLNHPVACDSLYAPKNKCPEHIGRLALHARSIEFKNINGENTKIESSLPQLFEKVLNS